MIKTRFAPSPTGFLHIGNLRAALFEYLFAKKNNGKFLLRIEDTDRERLVKGSIKNMLHTLSWAGIKPDEGVVLADGETIAINQSGNNGPYIQSERLVIYKKYVDQLLEQGNAYYCFCSKERLDEVRKYQEANKMSTGYDGHCRNLSPEEIKEKLDRGEKYVVRMKMPKEGMTEINDLIRGKVKFKNNLIDDQILLKTDGFPTYHLAVIVDDHLMGITHVIRGEEWLPSTPKHIELYKMFNWQSPQFAHLPMLVNKEKKKLSKRHGDVAVRDYVAKGYLPEALINFIAFLGWNPGNEKELFTLHELEKEFDLTKVGKAPAVFNLEKLDWYNQQYIRKMDISELTQKCLPFLIDSGLINKEREMRNEKREWLEKVVSLEKERMTKLSDLPQEISFIFADELEYDGELLIWKQSTTHETKNNLIGLKNLLNNFSIQEWNLTNLQTKIGEWITSQNLSNGEILWPMRVALSGQKNSPGPYEIAEVLQKEKTIQRIKIAIGKL